MSENSYLFAFVNSAKLVGLAGSGILAGYSFAATQSSTPYINTLCKTNPGEGIKAWENLYDAGAKVAVPVTAVTSLSLFIAAYFHPYLPLPVTPFKPQVVSSLDVGLQLALSGVIILSAMPWTGIAMIPNIKVLKGISKKVESREESGIPQKLISLEAEKQDVAPRVEKWGKQHLFRTVAYSLGFVVALSAF